MYLLINYALWNRILYPILIIMAVLLGGYYLYVGYKTKVNPQSNYWHGLNKLMTWSFGVVLVIMIGIIIYLRFWLGA